MQKLPQGDKSKGSVDTVVVNDWHEEYYKNVSKIARDLKVMGMFEIYDGTSYSVYNSSINPTEFDWKSYNNSLIKNERNLTELRFDLNDAVI